MGGGRDDVAEAARAGVEIGGGARRGLRAASWN